MPSARVGIECGLMQTAKQNKSGNSGRQQRRVERVRSSGFEGEAERKLPGLKPCRPQLGLSPAAGPSFPSTAEQEPFCLGEYPGPAMQ